MKISKSRFISIVMIAVMCICGSSVAIFAEDDIATTPVATNTTSASVTQTNYSLAGKYVSFTWNPVVDNSGESIVYALRMWKNSDNYKTSNKVINVKGLKNPKYNSKAGLLFSDSYKYQVVAYHAGESPVWASAYTADITLPSTFNIPLPTSFSVNFAFPDKAKNTQALGEIRQQDNTIVAKWSVDDPSLYSHFDVIRIKPNGKNVLVGSVNAASKSNYSFKYYSLGGKFDYKLYLYGNDDSCKCVYNATEAVSGPNVPAKYLLTDEITTNHSWYARALKNINLYKTPNGAVYTSVSRGTEMNATGGFSPESFGFWEEPTWVQVKYDGRNCWARWSQVKMCWRLTYKDYAWSVKEDYINSGNFRSNTDYLIWVSRYTNRTNVFHKEGGKWELIKVYDCNTGNYYQPLKGGQYYINGHEAIKYKIHRDGREYYFKYSTKFGGSGTFHTRCRWADTNNLRNAIKRHPTTKGCCRLHDEAAQYVYGLPTGTGVIIK